MDFRTATLLDVPLLARLNKQLINDERHRNTMSIEQLADRMSNWLETEYQATIFSLADKVVGAAVEWLRCHDWADAGRLRLDVLIGNERGIAFWRAVGFTDYCLTLEAEAGRPVRSTDT
jgi:hypothetical protein